MNSEPTEDLMVLWNCSRESVEIYRNRLRILMSVLARMPLVDNSKVGHAADSLCAAIHAARKPDGSEYSELSKKNFFDVAIREIELTHKIEDVRKREAVEQLKLELTKIEASYLKRQRPAIDYEELSRRIDELPKTSMKYFLMKVFLEVPVRDDLQLRFASWNEVCDDNTLHADPESPGRLVVTIRKSKNLKDPMGRRYVLSEQLSRDLHTWITALPQVISLMPNGTRFRGCTRQFPFGMGKHSRRVGSILKELGFKITGSSINILRRAIAEKAKRGTAEDIAAAALASLHSVATAHNAYESNA